MQVCDQFELGNTFNHGSTGTLHLARGIHQKQSDVWDLAAKLVQFRDDSDREAFLAEASATEALQGHGNVVEMLGAEIREIGPGFGVLVLEKGDCDLFDYMQAKGGLSIANVREIFFDIIMALAHCHRTKIAHRDIKPENVVMVGGRAKLADFGAAMDFYDDEDRICLDKVGTAVYSAPEVFDMTSHGYDCVKADIWSMGILFHVMLTGCWPYHRGQSKPSHDLLIVEERFAKVPECLDLLRKLLHADPDKRPTASEILLHPFFLPTQLALNNSRKRKASVPACRPVRDESSGRSTSIPSVLGKVDESPTVSSAGIKKNSIATRIRRGLRSRSLSSKMAELGGRLHLPRWLSVGSRE